MQPPLSHIKSKIPPRDEVVAPRPSLFSTTNVTLVLRPHSVCARRMVH